MSETAKPTVVEALSAVMETVQAIGKTGRNTSQNYSFRGVDAVVNAVGPALREHGVVVVPTGVEITPEHYTTKSGTPMKNVTATVTFRFYGPAGDFIDAAAAGEAADSGDKATPKAHSVAYRTLLLQALCIPTDEPDPDSQSHERAAAPEKGVQRPVAPTQRSWPEWTKAMSDLGVEMPEVWLQQATESAYGKPSLKDVTAEQRAEMLTKANTVLNYLVALDPSGPEYALGYVDDVTVRSSFAMVLGGVMLPGPPDPVTDTLPNGDGDADDVPFGES